MVQVRVGLRPLFDLRREISDVRKGKTERVGGAYPEELEPVVAELNALVTHNQEVVERQRTHVGNLAHALKTPLSVMLNEAGGAKGKLAGWHPPGRADARPCDHHRAAPARRPLAEPGDRTASGLDELPRPGRIFCPRPGDRLARAGRPLLPLRAARPAGDWAHVIETAQVGKARCGWTGGGRRGLLLTFEDDGPGLPPERRARCSSAAPGSTKRAGSGLGLAIVDERPGPMGGLALS